MRADQRARRRLLAVVLVATALWIAVAIVVKVGFGTDTHGADLEHFDVESAALGRSLRAAAVVPGGEAPEGGRPLLVFMHGRDGDEDSNLTDEMFAALEDLGERAPVMVFPTATGTSTGTTAARDVGAVMCWTT